MLPATRVPPLKPGEVADFEALNTQAHHGDDGFDFDAFENENCNASEPHVATALRAVLHEAVANASRKAALWYYS